MSCRGMAASKPTSGICVARLVKGAPDNEIPCTCSKGPRPTAVTNGNKTFSALDHTDVNTVAMTLLSDVHARVCI